MADHVDTHTHNLLYSFVGGSTKTPGKTPHVGRVGRVGGSWMFKSNGDQRLFGLEFRLGLHTQGPMRLVEVTLLLGNRDSK